MLRLIMSIARFWWDGFVIVRGCYSGEGVDRPETGQKRPCDAGGNGDA